MLLADRVVWALRRGWGARARRDAIGLADRVAWPAGKSSGLGLGFQGMAEAHSIIA